MNWTPISATPQASAQARDDLRIMQMATARATRLRSEAVGVFWGRVAALLLRSRQHLLGPVHRA